MTIYRLNHDLIFPDPSLAEPEGLLAVGGDLRLERILIAYSMGIFPWYSVGQPILWWSPDPRLILDPRHMRISKSLRRVLRSKKYTIYLDRDFPSVIRHCAEVERPDQDGTWITPEMIDAYIGLRDAGFAHSVETYYENELVGGLYGISMGKAFFGESMFSLKPDASKVAFAALSRILTNLEFDFIDCQVTTSHLISLGAKEIDRDSFLVKLRIALTHPHELGSWARFRGFVDEASEW